MKILIVSDLFPPDIKGGYELRCEEVCHWLIKNGYQVEVLTTKSKDMYEEHPFSVNRLLIQYPLGATPSHWTFIQKIFYAIKDNFIFQNVLRRFKPDFIYVFNCTGLSRTLIPNIFNSKIRKIVDVSSTWLLKVYSQHGPIYRMIESNHQKYPHRVFNLFLQLLFPIVSINTIQKKFNLNFHNVEGYFTSHWNKQYHAKYLDKCKEFEVIYTGIDLEAFPYHGRNFDSSTIKLLYVGRISKEKGFLLLLDQLDYLRVNSEREFNLTVIGTHDDNEKNFFLETIAELDLERSVAFKGQLRREELSVYYQQADFTVFPSVWDEPFSRVPLESMACGTPCISTDNPGSKELFDLNSPLIFLERTKDGLLKGIAPFLDNQEEYARVSRNGREFVEEAFTFDHFMKNVHKKIITNLNKSDNQKTRFYLN